MKRKTAFHNSETEKQAELVVTPDTHYQFLFFILFLLGSAMLLKRYDK